MKTKSPRAVAAGVPHGPKCQCLACRRRRYDAAFPLGSVTVPRPAKKGDLAAAIAEELARQGLERPAKKPPRSRKRRR